MPAVFLKRCKTEIAKPLYLIWRRCLDTGVTPNELLVAHVIPIHKGNHKSLPANYRPIALTSHLVKIFEKVVRNKLVSHLEDADLFSMDFAKAAHALVNFLFTMTKFLPCWSKD